MEYLKQALPRDLETKVAALGKVRLNLTALDPSDRLLREFYLFYLRVLDEIGNRQKDLAPRDKIDLIRVMDPIIFADLEWLPDRPYDEFFLEKAIDSGCGGALLCTLILLRPAADRRLKRKVLATLQKLSYPGDKQISRVLANLDEPLFPHVRLVKPFLERYPTETKVRKLLFDFLIFEANMFLLTNAMALEYEKSGRPSNKFMTFLQDRLQIFRREVIDLDDYEEVVVLKDLFECFPEGYLTTKGYHSLYLKIYSRQQNFDYLFAQLDHYLPAGKRPGQDEIFFPLTAGEWLDQQEELLFDFVIQYGDDLKTAPLATIRQVVDRFCRPEFMNPKGLNFFLGLSHQLKERLEAGDLAVEDLPNQIMSLLLAYRQTRKRPRRTRG